MNTRFLPDYFPNRSPHRDANIVPDAPLTLLTPSLQYGATNTPEHPDLRFEWRDNLDPSNNGFPLRCVIVASPVPLEMRSLVPLLES